MSLPQLIMLPGPTNVPARVYAAMCKPMINHRGPEFHELHSRVLENAKKVFQTENDLFVLTSSGTGGVECAASNFLLPGEKILVPVGGTFGERLADAFRTYGADVIPIEVKMGSTPTANQIKEVLKRERDAKAVAVVYNETSTGTTVRDLRQIGEVTKEAGALFIVDAISVLGGDDLPVDKWGVDVCITASQKCLATPPGLALISVSRDAWKLAERAKPRTEYFSLTKCKKFRDEKMETPFTPAVSLFFALDEALQMILETGLERWIGRHKKAGSAYYEAFGRMGLNFFAEEGSRSNVVIAINMPTGIAAKSLRDRLRTRYGVVVAGGFGALKDSIFRIGNMGVVTPREVVTTVSAVGAALDELGFRGHAGEGLNAAIRLISDL
ncbi:MAG: alanine--glyoxylate aminotransferase family protein [Candidatus Verstraetearchaeota archaeon]|nr:alanine--glyoxylate aminotransferase family protein [Candidatus Verstraetearchaeota archaeon]